MIFVIALIIAIGVISVLSSLAVLIGKIVLWVGLPLFVMLIVGLLVSNVAGPKAGAVGALLALTGIIACAKNIFS